jgi:hypothetical protein
MRAACDASAPPGRRARRLVGFWPVARDIHVVNQPAYARFDRLREAGTPRRGDMIGALFGGVAFVLAGGSPLAELLPSPALTARRLAATLKAAGEGFPYRYTVQVAGTLDLNDAAPLSPIRLPARTAAPRLAPRKPRHPLQPIAQPPRPTARSIITTLPALASTRSQHKPSRWHAAYFRGPATSAASSLRDSVQATLPQLHRAHCLHTPPCLGSPLASPNHPLQPRAPPPHP